MLKNPIFFDEKGKRWRFFNRLWWFLTITSSVLIMVFLISIFITPNLPSIHLVPFIAQTESEKPQQQSVKQEIAKVVQEKSKRDKIISLKQQKAKEFFSTNPVPTPSTLTIARPLSIGFYVNWDDTSYQSLKTNLNQLDWVVPEWIRLSQDPQNPLVLDIDQKALDLIQQEKATTPILPLVQNYENEEWNSQLLAKAVATESSRKNLINSLLDTVEKNKFGGLTIDLEEVPTNSQQNLFSFIEELHNEFQKRGLIIAQAVPFDNPDWNYQAYAKVTDYIMLMAYDQHWSTSQAGALAGQDWYENILQKRMKELDPAKTVVCIGNYGYNWIGKKGEDVSFQEAVLSAKESLDSSKDIKFDEATKNPYFSYVEEDGKTHNVWFLDAVTAYNEMHAAKPYNIAGFALWRLGSEDPSLWNVFGSSKQEISTDNLSSIKYGYDVDFNGTGEILQVKAMPQDGIREFKVDEKGLITNETYQAIPSSYVIQRTGDKIGKIALTFDDGPDPEWTPKILDILKQENIKACFFIIGENGQSNPDLIKRIVNEGHEIGNHSFTHPNLGDIPNAVTTVELNATQRLIESLTGRSTRLFRAPYFGDAEPRTPNEVDPTVTAQSLGYITVGLHLDPDDWKLKNEDGTPRTADDMVNLLLQQVAIKTPEERGEIVLMHDGGGDRSATVEALPKIIHELKNRGYQFTSISDLANITPEQAMPIVPNNQTYFADADSLVFYAASLFGSIIKWVFLLGIFLGIGRVLVIGVLAFAQWMRSRERQHFHTGENYHPFVSIVVPAYNEEKVINRTIQSLLSSNYPEFEIIVVDDGSADNTYEKSLQEFGKISNFSIYRKENGGKASALNYGCSLAKGEILIALDADTIFTKETVSALVKRFSDEKIGAVAGNAKVGNRLNIITKWQALEYVTSQNMDRRAFASLNCITVVPGSVGAWRKSVIEEAGGFSSDTLAEDQDLTISIRILGYQIGYAENAIGLTEAPDSLRSLAKQRFRWSYGTLQCMWKHRKALFNSKYGSLGFIAMPNIWIFQVIFPLLSPLMDLMFIWTFLSTIIGYWQHQKEYSPTNLTAVLFYYAIFLAIDWLGAFFAFLMERSEDKKLLKWLLIQRYGYRQIMYSVMVNSVFTAIKGITVGWGKLERKATVKAIE